MSTLRLDVLGTRVARRVLLLFTLGAVLPVAVMAALSFRGLSTQLREQSADRLTELTDVLTQSILERLIGFRTALEGVGLAAGPLGDGADDGSRIAQLPSGVLGTAVAVGDELVSLAGEVGEIPELSSEDRQSVADGQALLRMQRDERPVTAMMGVPFQPNDTETGVVWGRIVGDSIWARALTRADSYASLAELCILDADLRPIYCGSGSESILPGAIPAPAGRTGTNGRLDLEGPDDEHLVAWREVYLRSTFGAQPWTVAVSEPLSSVYGPVDSFAYNLLISLMIGLSGVLLLTHVLVRRTMEPLRDLTEGTRRIAARDLTTRVDVHRADEFGELADSFNSMAEQLGLQFRQLEARRAIDHAVVASNDQTDAVRALLEGVSAVTSSHRSALVLPESDLPDVSHIFTWDPEAGSLDRELAQDFSAEELLDVAGTQGAGAQDGRLPRTIRSLARGGAAPVILPLRAGGTLLGALAVGRAPDGDLGDEELERARHLADQAATALEKLRLDRELASMSWGTLRALANTIDAKSKWTTGHSERVTGLALAMGHELGLEAGDMEVLHRGGLLHDIGKIGIPAEILDSPGPLSAEARAIMEEHPVAGARILEPVRAFQPMIPIVLYHHERWDGDGYPEGLRGQEIPRLARLLAVADVFDAMVSPRPYRTSGNPDAVCDHIRSESGLHFDPEMVEAFNRIMEAGWRPGDVRSPASVAVGLDRKP